MEELCPLFLPGGNFCPFKQKSDSDKWATGNEEIYYKYVSITLLSPLAI